MDTKGNLKKTTFINYLVYVAKNTIVPYIKAHAVAFTIGGVAIAGTATGGTIAYKKYVSSPKTVESTVKQIDKEEAKSVVEEVKKPVEVKTPSINLYNFYTLTGDTITGELVNQTDTEYVVKTNGKITKYLKSDIFKYEKK